MSFQKANNRLTTPPRDTITSARDRIDAWFKRPMSDALTCMFPSDQLLRHRRAVVEELKNLEARSRDLTRMCCEIDRLRLRHGNLYDCDCWERAIEANPPKPKSPNGGQ